ncbi:MAG: hypothetical protein NUV77_21500, partial [Thermoguttaceae bacterium]|nr:hypothetical protein [Thermoguttaceae bacterium]
TREAETAKREIEYCQNELKELGLQTALDAAGIIDPTPTSDLLSAANSIRRKDYVGAGLTLLGVVPYVGDALGKTAKGALIASRVARLKSRLESALRALKVAEAAIQQARKLNRAQKLLRHALSAVEKAAIRLHKELPLLRNPRLLKKHPGPVPIKDLVGELISKGFYQVKKGEHGLQGLPENSDIFLRKIVVNGEEVYDCVRIDRRFPNPGFSRGVSKTPSQIQSGDKLSRRVHSTLDAPEVPSQKEMVTDMQSGRLFKGDFSHWHHEQFAATEKNLAKYLTPPRRGPDGRMIFEQVPGLKKYDASGQLVGR